MTDHELYKERLSALLDGELNEAERAETLAHLDACESCRVYFAELTALHEALSDTEDFDVPEGFAAGVMARLHETEATRTFVAAAPKKRAAWRGWAALAACAAVVLLAVTVAPNMFRMGKSAPAATENASMPAAAPNVSGQALMSMDAPTEETAENYLETEMLPAASDASSAPIPEPGTPKNGEDRAAAGGLTAVCTEAPPETAANESNADLSGKALPVLLLTGADAEKWLSDNGTRDEDKEAYWIDAALLETLPDGLRLEGSQALVLWNADGYSTVLVRAEKTEDGK